MKQLRIFTSHTYTHGEDIQDLVWNLHHTIIRKPKSVDENDTNVTTKRIWEKQVDEYVKHLNRYESNKKNLYYVVWNQWSPTLQVRMESLPNFKSFDRESDFLQLLTENKSTVCQFESQVYLHESMLQAKEDLVKKRGEIHQRLP